jgi:hypothetical protein
VGRENPNAFHVAFAFEYDINMILVDLEWRYLAILTDTGKVKWHGYTIKHLPHKQFSVSKAGITVTIFDAFGFFHCSYLSALNKFKIGSRETLAHISSGKAGRSTFTYADLQRVIEYWTYEISLLPPLMDKLRESCYTAGFYITQWHGPGALAAFALKQYKAQDYHPPSKGPHRVPKQVQIARRCAYAGGRFQGWKCGHYIGAVYTADINSAYAAACARLPRLDNGYWRRIPREVLCRIASRKDVSEFGIYRIRYDARSRASGAAIRGVPFPLFHRDKKGNLTWPPYVENWYWSPEAGIVAADDCAEFLEGWEYVSDNTTPFDFVRGAYDRRLQLQMAGDYTEKAYKWMLASMYGQFAQRVGWNRYNRTPPRSHCLEWAGYITSYCRAMVYFAAAHIAKDGGLVSIDTDGITSTIPFDPRKLPNGVGDGLGQWKLESFSEIIYWQNGVYWLRDLSGEWKDPKTRGLPRGTIDRSSALDTLAHNMDGRVVDSKCAFTVYRKRFIGYRQGLRGQWDNWRHWKLEQATVVFGGSGKGRHIPEMCDACRGIAPLGSLHTIRHLWSIDEPCQAHHLPWLIPPQETEQGVEIEGGIWEDATLGSA